MPIHKQREDAKRELTHGQRFTILHSVYQPPYEPYPAILAWQRLKIAKNNVIKELCSIFAVPKE